MRNHRECYGVGQNERAWPSSVNLRWSVFTSDISTAHVRLFSKRPPSSHASALRATHPSLRREKFIQCFSRFSFLPLLWSNASCSIQFCQLELFQIGADEGRKTQQVFSVCHKRFPRNRMLQRWSCFPWGKGSANAETPHPCSWERDLP